MCRSTILPAEFELQTWSSSKIGHRLIGDTTFYGGVAAMKFGVSYQKSRKNGLQVSNFRLTIGRVLKE